MSISSNLTDTSKPAIGGKPLPKPDPSKAPKKYTLLIIAVVAILSIGAALGTLGTLWFQSITDSEPEPLRQIALIPAAGNSEGTIEDICGSNIVAPLTQDGSATVGNLRVSTRWTGETATISFANENNALVSAHSVASIALETTPGVFRVAELTSLERSAYFLSLSNMDWGPMAGRTVYVCKT